MIHRQRLVSILAAISIVTLWFVFSSNKLSYSTSNDINPNTDTSSTQVDGAKAPKPVLGQEKIGNTKLESIMPSMPDQKAKEELGRASWKYFHTVLARFPDEPTTEEREKLSQFLQLYAELYPCGECSYHFVQMLKKWPPQTSSRITAAMWGCHMHNRVNEHLKKDEFDCSRILTDYDCGCGGEDGKIDETLKLNKVSLQKEGKQGG
ncbi:LANO_0G07074g1_1 [Lachancea nothofagi CBS 11611]|uniref:Sulfhydryl oxidase n=1 Tax=Lachancea nothofagi CBS 11611 TaxID=1266666 RepID=A0A1G4KHH5_9SACH|nr:LANO_0G07074g1_1 [Lachancea nothofagi CBS 11611]